jgi:hypothetical protein
MDFDTIDIEIAKYCKKIDRHLRYGILNEDTYKWALWGLIDRIVYDNFPKHTHVEIAWGLKRAYLPEILQEKYR